MSDREDTLEHARETFAEAVSLKVEQLGRFVRGGENPAIVGSFIEELVRGFVREWLGGWELVTGALYSKSSFESGETPMQLDGIVYDPRSGPAIIREGGFAVVNPAFCPAVIEIKKSLARTSMDEFVNRLQNIYRIHMHDRSAHNVMGIVIHDRDPEKTSYRGECGTAGRIMSYEDHWGGKCPVFILFRQKGGTFEPFEPGIDGMMKRIFALREPPGTGYY